MTANEFRLIAPHGEYEAGSYQGAEVADVMIRVLQVGASANPGGIENCIVRYFRHIDRAEFVFDFADIYGEGLAYSDEIRALGGNIYTFHNCKKRPLNMMYDMSELLKSRRYDIIHIHMLSAANLLPAFVACRAKTSRVIVHSHNASVPSGALRKAMNWVNNSFLRRMPTEHWACSKMAGVWMWGNGFREANVLPNAIETEVFRYNEEKRKRMREECGYTDEQIVVGFVGRLCEQKNVLFLPEIMGELVNKSPNYRMLIVGDGDLRERFLQKVHSMRLDDYVFMPGLQSDVASWYQAMDAFVLPSLFEGLPIVALEAQEAGLPCFLSENITKECALTKRCHFLPLNSTASVWAASIDCNAGTNGNRCEELPQSYQIGYAAKTLEQRYMRLLSSAK